MAVKISYISREGPLDMLEGLTDGLLDDLRDEGVGRVLAARLTIDADRGRAIVDIVGEVCEGEVALRIFAGGYSIQSQINDWMEENGIEDFRIDLVRSDGRVYILVVGRRGFA